MTIKRYTDFIAEQQRKLRGAGLAETKAGWDEWAKDMQKNYPTSHKWVVHPKGEKPDTSKHPSYDIAGGPEKGGPGGAEHAIASHHFATNYKDKNKDLTATKVGEKQLTYKEKSAPPKGDHPFKTYPPEHNMHLETAEGEEHHVIQGIKHTQENADHVFHEINKAGAKIAKMSTREFEAINGDTPFHHTLRSPESLGAGDKPTKVHKSVEDYVNHHARLDAAWVKGHLDEQIEQMDEKYSDKQKAMKLGAQLGYTSPYGDYKMPLATHITRDAVEKPHGIRMGARAHAAANLLNSKKNLKSAFDRAVRAGTRTRNRDYDNIAAAQGMERRVGKRGWVKKRTED